MVLPERNVSQQTMDEAMAVLHAMVDKNRPPKPKKPWWKFC